MASFARPPSALGGLTAALLAAQALLAFATALVAGWTVLTYAGLSGGTLDILLAPDRATLGLLLATSAMSVVTGLVLSSGCSWPAATSCCTGCARVVRQAGPSVRGSSPS
jgi:hypothetical protein